jgi:shikimate dehydrogenase
MNERIALGLIGYPLAHSLSPQMHHAALQAAGLEGEYTLYPIFPLPEGAGVLEKLLAKLRRGELRGLNVTIPHKQNVIAWLDELTGQARDIGAVNTLLMQGGRLVGDNTDAAGFLADLDRLVSREAQPAGCPQAPLALVLGAGGSARAVVYALASSGWQVTVSARRLEQAQGLAASLSTCLGKAPTINTLPLDASGLPMDSPPRLIVNTTPVGMFRHHPEPTGSDVASAGASPWPEKWLLPPGAAIYDLVYNPPETPLMRDARASGHPVSNGLGMLAEQAALAFKRWTGRKVPLQVMLQALERKK